MLAALEGKTEVFHYLRENGANISIHNNDDDIALHSAALSDSADFQALTG
jgi:ankyrin repeat protein